MRNVIVVRPPTGRAWEEWEEAGAWHERTAPVESVTTQSVIGRRCSKAGARTTIRPSKGGGGIADDGPNAPASVRPTSAQATATALPSAP